MICLQAEEADRLIGEGLFLKGIAAQAIRSMRAPAYDDPVQDAL